MSGLLLAAMLMLSTSTDGAQRLPQVRTWSFDLPHGSLRIDALPQSDGAVALRIGPDGSDEAPVVEQIGPLKRVLAEMMSTMSTDPRRVSEIVMLTWGDDVQRALAYGCADLPDCRPKEPFSVETMRMLVRLLNQSGVFGPYNEAFEPYGLRATVVSAEHIGLIALSAVPARHASDRANGRRMVFGGSAAIRLRLTPIN